jgi:hypothetical protein
MLNDKNEVSNIIAIAKKMPIALTEITFFIVLKVKTTIRSKEKTWYKTIVSGASDIEYSKYSVLFKSSKKYQDIYSVKPMATNVLNFNSFNILFFCHITPKAAARVSASSPQGDAAFACYVFNSRDHSRPL